jgi:hypothetical protein
MPANYLLVSGNKNVDNAFSVPAASRCGLGLGLINCVIDAKLKLPAGAGNNEIVLTNDIAIATS